MEKNNGGRREKRREENAGEKEQAIFPPSSRQRLPLASLCVHSPGRSGKRGREKQTGQSSVTVSHGLLAEGPAQRLSGMFSKEMSATPQQIASMGHRAGSPGATS